MLSEIRFKMFKSFIDAKMPVEPVTILIGANASGKSNAVDALQILAGLATNRKLVNILDGIRGQEKGIRGGSRGAPRYDSPFFQLGCSLKNGNYVLDYDVKIGVKPKVSLLKEAMYQRIPGTKARRKLIYSTSSKDNKNEGITVTFYNNDKEIKPVVTFSRDYSILSQISGKFPDHSTEMKHMFEKTASILSNILIFSPAPHLMRDYVHHSRTEMVPTAENLSAVVADLMKDYGNKKIILKYLQDLPDQHITDIKVLETPTGDVMLSFVEKIGNESKAIDVRGMSDGTLRFLAILVALLGGKTGTTLVIEEVDNGLHPGRTNKLIGALRELGKGRGIDTIVTTHNPALLNALKAEDVPGVVLCYRDEHDGGSRFKAWVDLPDYPALMARGRIGELITDTQTNLLIAAKRKEDLLRWVEGRLGH